jgi:hypothetical protein
MLALNSSSSEFCMLEQNAFYSEIYMLATTSVHSELCMFSLDSFISEALYAGTITSAQKI